MLKKVRKPKAKVHPLARTKIGVQPAYERTLLRLAEKLTKYSYLDLPPRKEVKCMPYKELGELLAAHFNQTCYSTLMKALILWEQDR